MLKEVLMILGGIILAVFIVWNGITIKIGDVLNIEIYPLSRFFN